MAVRTAPYLHSDGSPCWTKNCSRSLETFIQNQDFNGYLNARLQQDAAPSPRPRRIKSVAVYRNGDISIGDHQNEEVKQQYALVDSVKPNDGRVGRQDSIFASPTVRGVGRWVKANELTTQTRGKENSEIKVNPANVYVYSIDEYEKAALSSHNFNNPEAYRDYWASGIPLSEWNKVATERKLDATKWEILVPETDIIEAKPISSRRIITAQDDGSYLRRELMWVLESRKAARSIQW